MVARNGRDSVSQTRTISEAAVISKNCNRWKKESFQLPKAGHCGPCNIVTRKKSSANFTRIMRHVGLVETVVNHIIEGVGTDKILIRHDVV